VWGGGGCHMMQQGKGPITAASTWTKPHIISLTTKSSY
jgi:hypothetical protein